jgi:hypothetical protein
MLKGRGGGKVKYAYGYEAAVQELALLQRRSKYRIRFVVGKVRHNWRFSLDRTCLFISGRHEILMLYHRLLQFVTSLLFCSALLIPHRTRSPY